MSSSFKIKVVAIGHRSAKNILFHECNRILSPFSESGLMTVGVSIKVGHYLNDSNGDNLTMSIWDISKRQRFGPFYTTFFRGAAAYLLFYEISNEHSYSEIEGWINIIRTFSVFTPIFLIAYKSDLKIKFDFEDIKSLIEEHQIQVFYLLSIRKKTISSKIFNDISQKILENIGTESSIQNCRNNLSTYKAKIYRDFINYFSECPICGRKNDIYNLNRIYFHTKLNQIKFKDSLLSLMEQTENQDKDYLNRIKVGIPCCSCHQKVFS